LINLKDIGANKKIAFGPKENSNKRRPITAKPKSQHKYIYP
jgi:hypothetical protein